MTSKELRDKAKEMEFLAELIARLESDIQNYKDWMNVPEEGEELTDWQKETNAEYELHIAVWQKAIEKLAK